MSQYEKVATLIVYKSKLPQSKLGDGEEEETSGFYARPKSRVCFLIWRPVVDKELISGLAPVHKKPKTVDQKTILAHELGHFVQYLTGDNMNEADMSQAEVFDHEAEAWDIAAEENIPLDKLVKQISLLGYSKKGIP